MATPLYAIFDATHLGGSLELEQSGTVLTVNAIADINRTALALFPESVGIWYAELMVWGDGDLLASIGVSTPAASLATYAGGDANGYGYRLDLGQIHNGGASVASVPVAAKGYIVGVLLDLTTTQPTASWYLNGLPIYTQALPSTGPWALAASVGGSEPYGMRCFLNTGQRAFEFPIPGVDGWYEPPQEIRGLRIASEDWLSATTDAVPNERYSGLMAGDNSELRAVRSLDFWPWQRGIKTGAMVLSVLDDGDTFGEILSGDARDLPVAVSRINAGQTFADRTPVYTAIIDSATATDDLSVKLTCRDPLGLLDVPAQRMLIRPSADPASANTPRPILLGACRNVPAVLLDPSIYSYAICDTPLLGIGYVRDSGYPLDPAALPPDFTLSSTKLGIHLHAEPTGKVTLDGSSVGGQQLPEPADDILAGVGAPFTGADGSAPDGWTTGSDDASSKPVLSGGKLVFPQVMKSATIKIEGRVRTDAFVAKVPIDGSPYGALVRITWYSAAGVELRKDISSTLTGTNGYTTLSVTGTAPDGAVRADAEYAAYAHTGGYMRTGKMRAWYVMTSGDVEIALDNGDFASGDTGWFREAGWSIKTDGLYGDGTANYGEKAPGHSDPDDDELYAAMRNSTMIDFGGWVAYTAWSGVTAAKLGAGKSYQLRITIDAMPEGGGRIGIATGTTADTLLASWSKPGTYAITITNSDGVDHDLYLLSIPLPTGITPVPPTVSAIQVIAYDDTWSPPARPTDPATLQPIKLADYVHQILDVRAETLGMSWSLSDAQTIDTATGYAGTGVYLAGGETTAQALDMALASYTACKWCDASGTLRISRMIAPESAAPVGTIDINAMGGDLVPVMDNAPGLTTQMGVRRNWAQLSDGDLVEPSLNFPLAVRQSMLRTFQQTASSAQPLAGAYRHALYASPVASCFDQQADGQAEIDRICAIYTVPRWFYACTVELDALPDLDLGQVWTLTYPKYGLAAGKLVMVIDYEPDLLAGTANIILWG